ncbi:MAG: hypothetical protein ACEQSR_10215 [Candidatus Methylacidiphilales bacterium]
MKSNLNDSKPLQQNNFKKNNLILFSIGLVIFSIWAYYIMINNPIDIAKSDIIPYINDLYLKRLFNNEYVYELAPGLGYGNWTPNYLTFHWLPFAISYYFHFDHRWIVLAAFFISIYVYLFHFIKYQNSNEYWLKASLPFIFLANLFYKQASTFAHTVELLIGSYYFILGMYLLKNQLVGKSIGITLTVLSRYLVIFYIPIALVIEYFANKKLLLKQVLLVLLLVLVFYIIPFMIKDPNIFFKGAASYDLAALGEWDGQSWQPVSDRPFQLFQGLGFASWGYNFLPGSLTQKIQMFKIIMITTIIITILLTIYYIVKNRLKIQPEKYNLASLKLILTVLLSFSLVPYPYLFWTNLILSIVMLGGVSFNKQTFNLNV